MLGKVGPQGEGTCRDPISEPMPPVFVDEFRAGDILALGKGTPTEPDGPDSGPPLAKCGGRLKRFGVLCVSPSCCCWAAAAICICCLRLCATAATAAAVASCDI